MFKCSQVPCLRTECVRRYSYRLHFGMLAYTQMRLQVLSSTVPAHRMCWMLFIVVTFWGWNAAWVDRSKASPPHPASGQKLPSARSAYHPRTRGPQKAAGGSRGLVASRGASMLLGILQMLELVVVCCNFFVFVNNCCYLLLFGTGCYCLFTIVAVCGFVFVTICWYLLLFADIGCHICYYWLLFVVICYYLLSFVAILVLFVTTCFHLLLFAGSYLLLFVASYSYLWII